MILICIHLFTNFSIFNENIKNQEFDVLVFSHFYEILLNIVSLGQGSHSCLVSLYMGFYLGHKPIKCVLMHYLGSFGSMT